MGKEREREESWLFFFSLCLFSRPIPPPPSLFSAKKKNKRTLTPAVVELGDLLPGRLRAPEAREAPLPQRGASSSSCSSSSSGAALAATGLLFALVQLVLREPRKDVFIDSVEASIAAAIPGEARRREEREQIEVGIGRLPSADAVAAGLILRSVSASASAPVSATEDRVAVVVVPRPLLRVREDLVGVLDLFEAGRGAVGVVLVFI